MSNENLLYFLNNDIDPKKYFAEKRRLEENRQANRNKKKDINNIKKIDNISYYSSEYSEFEDEETKNKREEIIQKMEAKTDDIIFEKDFDIFDYSKMDSDISEFLLSGEKVQNEQTININDNSMTYYTSPNNTDTELFKKSKNKNKKRKNRFKLKGSKKEKRIDKSNSIRKRERSRFRSNSSFSKLDL